jgi:hypothetical protein
VMCCAVVCCGVLWCAAVCCALAAGQIPNEGNGTLDVESFVFTDDEKKWLHSIDALEERWAERLLVNGTDTAKTLSSGNAKGKSEATWHAKFHDTKAAARAAGGDDVG